MSEREHQGLVSGYLIERLSDNLLDTVNNRSYAHKGINSYQTVDLMISVDDIYSF